MDHDSLVGLGAPERTSRSCRAGGEAHYYCIATKELRYCNGGDAKRARDDSELTVRH